MGMSAKNEPHATIEATIIRADGTRIELGVISEGVVSKDNFVKTIIKKIGGK